MKHHQFHDLDWSAPGFDKCNLSVSMVDGCVERAMEKAFKVLATGYEPLGIFPFDPLEITNIVIDQGYGPVTMRFQFIDLLISGLQDTKVDKFTYDLKNLTLSAKVFIENLDLNGKYDIKGRILILPITGSGLSQLKLYNATANITLHGTLFRRSDEDFMKVKKLDFQSLEIEKLRIQLDNLFNGNKALGDNMNKFMNQNWRDIFMELRPAIQETFGIPFQDIANRIFTKVPLREIFGAKSA